MQPFEVWELEAAWRWRRDREWDQRAITATLALMAAGGGDSSYTGILDEVRFLLPGYEPEK